jgi:hypothetical protein
MNDLVLSHFDEHIDNHAIGHIYLLEEFGKF